MSIIIQIIVIFILLGIYFSSTGNNEKADWGRALVIAIALPLLSLLPNYLGVIGWLVALIIALLLIAKATGQSITGSFLFLMVLGFLLYFIELGIQRFI